MRERLRATTIVASVIVLIGIAIAGIAWTVSASASTAHKYAEYCNDRWHYSLAVPAGMTVAEHEREGDGQTVQYLDADADYKFQIPAWPYTQLDLTFGREGAPATSSDQPDHLEIVDVMRDDMFTVLFHKNGIRYCVVALPEDEAWLTDILTSWRFTE